MSQMFSQTLRQAPAGAEVKSHRLLLRAGFIRQLAAGLFSYLPLAKRSLAKIENILREEMNAIGGQEISMPVVHPAELWKETGRWYEIGSELGRFKDKNEREMALAMTHEEVIGDLVRKEIRSHRQLPQLLYHIQIKWRDDPRPRAGLIRAREFTMKDSYSLDADEEGLDRQYRNHYQAYFNIFNRCALPTLAVRSDVGMMGGSMAHEFMYPTPIGEDTLLICDACGYTANRQIAEFRKPPAEPEEPRKAEKIETPGADTIEKLARFLGIPESKTAKAFFAVATITEGTEDVERFVLAVVRGDMEVNETKLANAVRAKELRPAREEEIRHAGASPGYGSPVGVKDALVVVDDAVKDSPNLAAGANEDGYHLINTNYGLDYEADIVSDIALAGEGDACPRCGEAMRTTRGVEVGNIFKLGTRYSEPLGCTFLDAEGDSKPVLMGSYGIGVGRLLACVAEEHNDENGLVWPITVAPYEVHLISLGGGEAVAEDLYRELTGRGVEVLYDDRDERPGVKFNDADLIGNPIRLTVGARSLERGGVELKLRREQESELVPVEEVAQSIERRLAALRTEIEERVVEVPFEE
ncbi:proline--tRNA ligase [Rubrobacter taiwanensis]|uniref:Proline--tRNA ligase n=1 Tax=Rubrobacter taiwanensis TaxID=185139 RepID=A0A4R1BFW7_9ACTN|nr:proline--tRNA ligase [Rubrobacter taiwanensis]TCJ16027.1 proline--tRNA ligase [Rubrobacter taiwanensis]